MLQGQPLHPIKPALQIFTDASKEGWGAHLNEHTARGTWSLPESKLYINYLELKVVFLALKEFQDLCSDKIVLIATDNTTVVSYLNKEGGMKSGPLCALLWRILTWCRTQVTLKARHIPGWLNKVANKLSRLGQTIQTEWSLLPEVFQAICSKWHRPQIDLFATRFNNKLPLFVSPVPDPLAWGVDALSLPWEVLDAYAFPPVAILAKVVEKLQDHPCHRQSGPFLQNGASVTRWTPCEINSLFQDRKLQPSTIDGYRSAIADKLGNSPINVSKDENLTVSWIVSTETDPKGGGAFPPGTSPWFYTS